MKIFKLTNWELRYLDKAQSPGRYKLYGEVYGNPRFEDGTPITTSELTAVDNEDRMVVYTWSGAIYKLGEMKSTYRQWLTDNGYKIDESWPIKIRTPRGLN